MSDQESIKARSAEPVQLPRRTFTVEFWVGIFAIAGVACMSYLAINIGGLKLSGAGFYKIDAVFSNISGLQVGAPVEIAGVQIGEVADISLNGTEAIVTLQVREQVPIRDDDIAQIRTKGIIGDKYIKISPGASDDHLGPGDRVSDTESSVEFEEIIGKFIHSLDSGE